MNIAIYTRKSNYSDKSDSTAVQYKLCVDYAKLNYKIDSIVKYEDEGFTGADTNRPAFISLMKDIEYGKIDVLICYRIDRVSRDIRDFCNTYYFFKEHNVEFVSLGEQIDTTTPLGRTMMYVCSAFAQMEREATAERVRDNMIELAKSGRWTGGNPPIGYKRKKIIVDGKKHTTIVKDEKTYPFYKMVCDTFLESGLSLTGLQTYFKNHNITSYNNYFFHTTQFYNILSNPHYVAADKDVYTYFKNKGCIMAVPEECFDGTHGLIVYGRTVGGRIKKHTKNPPEKWYVSVGLHKPLIDSKTWLAIQSKFSHNKMIKARKHTPGYLNGIIRCGCCGRTLSTKYKYDKQLNKEYRHYVCYKRLDQGSKYCSYVSIQTYKVDEKVFNILKQIQLDKSLIDNYMPSQTINSTTTNKLAINKEIKSINTQIENLTNALTTNTDSSAAKYIIKKIETLDKKISTLYLELREIEFQAKKQKEVTSNKESKFQLICELINVLDTGEFMDINSLLKEIIVECTYHDGVVKLTL